MTTQQLEEAVLLLQSRLEAMQQVVVECERECSAVAEKFRRSEVGSQCTTLLFRCFDHGVFNNIQAKRVHEKVIFEKEIELKDATIAAKDRTIGALRGELIARSPAARLQALRNTQTRPMRTSKNIRPNEPSLVLNTLQHAQNSWHTLRISSVISQISNVTKARTKASPVRWPPGYKPTGEKIESKPNLATKPFVVSYPSVAKKTAASQKEVAIKERAAQVKERLAESRQGFIIAAIGTANVA